MGNPPGSDELPDHLKGVFWFETNAAPELLMTMQGSSFFKSNTSCCYNWGSPYINLDSGAAFNWTHSSDCMGWLYWAALRFSWILCSELHVNFHDEEMKNGT